MINLQGFNDFWWQFCGEYGIRTHDLLHAMQAL